MTSAVRLENLTLRFDQVVAVDAVDLDIEQGEFFGLLGPSGSGKTSCLRLIAGFEQASSGSVYINGENVGDLPPFERNVNTVFQDYALFPHMNVADNVGYGLMIRGEPPAKRAARVDDMLAAVKLDGMGRRRTLELSGGQRQRVALARALINNSKIILLDEPLGALDLKLREQMQEELKSLQKRLGLTFIYVTHDQQEALSMCDRVAVFNHGRIEQTGTPRDIYQNPQTAFVAGFVGASNLLDASTARDLFGIDSPVSIRPENIAIVAGNGGLAGRVTDISYQGPANRITVEIDGGTSLVLVEGTGPGAVERRPGDGVNVTVDRSMIRPLETS